MGALLGGIMTEKRARKKTAVWKLTGQAAKFIVLGMVSIFTAFPFVWMFYPH